MYSVLVCEFCFTDYIAPDYIICQNWQHYPRRSRTKQWHTASTSVGKLTIVKSRRLLPVSYAGATRNLRAVESAHGMLFVPGILTGMQFQMCTRHP